MKTTFSPNKEPVILGFDTSGAHCRVGIARGNDTIYTCEFFQPFLHDRVLAETCRLALHNLKISFGDLSAIAVVGGPGSFTGLRIGVSFARALCLPLHEQNPEPHCITLSTLEIFAAAAVKVALSRQKTSIITVLPSHKRYVYTQKFTVQAEVVETLQLMTKEDVFIHPDPSALYCGQGLQEYADQLNGGGMECDVELKTLLQLALQKYREGNFADPMTFAPNYGQEFIPRVG